MNHLYFRQTCHYQKEYDVEINCIQNKHFDRFSKSSKEQNIIYRHHKSTSFQNNIKKHRTKLTLQRSLNKNGNRTLPINFQRYQNRTESTQADPQQIINPYRISKSPKRKTKYFQNGFQLIKKQKVLRNQVLKSMGLKQNIKVFDINYSNIRLCQLLQIYNKVNFQLIMKLIYYQGFQPEHLDTFLEIAFKRVCSDKNFFDILLEETYQFSNILNQNLNLIIEKKILRLNKDEFKSKHCFIYFRKFSKLYKRFFDVFDIIFEHFQYILEVYKYIERISELYQEKQNRDFNTPQIKFGQHIKNTLLKNTFSENHVQKFLLEARQYFFNYENFYSKQVNFQFKYQLNEILQIIDQVKYHQEKILEEKSDQYDKDDDDMYDDDCLSYTQSQLEEERQNQEYRKQQKKKEKRRRKKKKQKEKKQKLQIQNQMKQQEEVCQKLKSIFLRIDKAYKTVKFEKIKINLDSKNFKTTNYFGNI